MVRKKRAGQERKKPVKKLTSQPFWITFGAVFLISVLIIFADSEGLTGHSTVQSISFMKVGSILELEPNVNGLKYANVHVVADVKNAIVTVEEIEQLSWNFRGVIISKFKISSTAESNFGQIDLTLKLKEEELKSKGLKNEDLMIYHNGQELATTLDKMEGEYLFFKVVSPGMGEFLIGKMIPEAAAEPVAEQPAEAQEPAETAASEEPTAAEAGDQTAESTEISTPPAAEERSFWARIVAFFRNIFR